jgi:beta-glucosidase
MESKNKTNYNRWFVILGVTTAVALVVGLGYLGVQNKSIVETVSAPIRALSQKPGPVCAARHASQLFTDIFTGTKAPTRVRILHMEEAKNLTMEEVGVPPLEKLLNKMSLEEMIGQIVQPENGNTKCYQVSDNKVGSVFFGGNDSPGEDLPEDWHKRVNKLQEEALSTGPNHIPIFIGVDTIHGMSHMRKATLFPHNIALGCTRNEKLVEQVGKVTATESAAADVNWGFSPCVALATDIRWGRVYESFGQDPDLVGRMGAAYVRGANSIQKPFVTCGKHFVGDGGVRYGTGRVGKPLDRGDWSGTMDELRDTHMKPYEYLVKAGVKSMMASYSSVNGKLMHGNGDLINTELKERMGFKGFVSSDYNAINALDSNYHKATAKAINAGVDQIMLGPAGGSHPYPNQLVSVIKDNVQSGAISKERIKDAARRVLWAKFESGLMHQQPKTKIDMAKTAVDAQLSVIGNAKHRDIARQAVQESVVVLENKHKVLPLDIKKRKLCVIGKAADNVGEMLGGWTLDWQGRGGAIPTHATSVWKGIEKMAKEEGVPTHVKLVQQYSHCQGSDVALVVVGERPYAEFMGDITVVPKLSQTVLVQKIQDEMNIPTVLLTISARPVNVDEAVEKAAGFVVSFVPGTEGGLGISDVLFGKVAPKGKLSMDWPKAGHALVRIAKDETLLYKYGDGLTWQI